ncbi:MAG: preprotein translocase subunit SecG [Deltaproteobacteria bacterium]|nr:preprotein translocase subunit SecG [Deltaproteobacteria bacterium]
MYTFLVIIHSFVSLILIMVVLLQSGKGASMGAAFGGGGQTMFGARGQTTGIQKMTVGAAVLFMVLSVVLASLSSTGRSDLEDDRPPLGQEAGMMAPDEEAGDEAKKDEAIDEAKAEPAKKDEAKAEEAGMPAEKKAPAEKPAEEKKTP